MLFFQRTCIFQSTPSAWRETCLDHSDPPQHRYFNPLPPHGGRRCTTHRLLWKMHFNPLPPHGGRLGVLPVYQCRIGISIHSLRMEGDSIRYAVSLFPPYFNPLPPHGGRRCSPSAFSSTSVFQSTPSAWRETVSICAHGTHVQFQSTPSAWRETSNNNNHNIEENHFNPLPPHGGRRTSFPQAGSGRGISIHSLRMEGD